MSYVPIARHPVDELPCLSRCCRDHRDDDPGVRLCETVPVLVPVGTDTIGETAELLVYADRCLVDDADYLLWASPARITLGGPLGSLNLTRKAARHLADSLYGLLDVVDDAA